MDAAEKLEYIAALEEKEYREAGRRFYRCYPDEGPFSRDKYAKHLEFFRLGRVKQYRCFAGANGSGKSFAGGYETVAHLTGDYPDWWNGWVYDHAIQNWTCGVDFKSLRESIQMTMLGPRGQEGTGLIPRQYIDDVKYSNQGVLDYVMVRRLGGGFSRMLAKCYEQGRESFQAANVDDIWMDEEPREYPIYSESIQRFRGATKHGRLRITMTPLFGVTEVVSQFMPKFQQNFDADEYEASGRACVICTVDDIPHVDAEEKTRKAANMRPWEREARLYGEPTVGQGRVFPFEEASYVIKPLEQGLPKHWPRLYGLDVGARITAAVWGAIDPDSDTVYIYSEHYNKSDGSGGIDAHKILPSVNATAIKARGAWIPGVIDPYLGVSRSVTGEPPIEAYKKLGLRLAPAEREEVGDGLMDMHERFATGRLKIYETCVNLRREIRTYSTDDKHKIIKHDDDTVDAARYMIRSIKRAMLPHEAVQARMPKTPEMNFGIYG